MAYTESPYGKFFYFKPDCIGREVARGVFVDGWLRPYMDRIGAGAHYVDIGASLGFYVVYMANRGVTVDAFEASPEVFGLLKNNVELNNCVGVNLYQEALLDEEKEMWLERTLNQYPVTHEDRIDYENTDNSAVLCLVPKEKGEELKGYHFVTKTLDSFQVQSIDLLKVDTQGADLRILHGAKETISRCRPLILFEHEPELLSYHGDDFSGFVRFFGEMGYQAPRYIGGVDYVAEPI